MIIILFLLFLFNVYYGAYLNSCHNIAYSHAYTLFRGRGV